MRVLALTKYGTRAASARQRFAQYAPFLASHGVELHLSPLIDDRQFGPIARGDKVGVTQALRSYGRRVQALTHARSYDLIWVQYELFPYLPGFVERVIGLTRTPFVVDLDDAIFHMYDAHPSAPIRTLLGRKLQPLLRSAQAAICGNDYLRDYAARFCGHVVVVPTVVDTEIFLPLPRPTGAPVTIGWIGSPSTFRDVAPLVPAIRSAAERNGGIFRAIGGGPLAAAQDGIESADWAEDREVADVQAMDVGIMPVTDRPFQRGKCGYKLIQYMACGLPVVASPVGINSRLAIPGETGYLAQTEAEWLEALDRLLKDPSLRARLGAAGRKLVQDNFSLASQQPVILETLVSAAGSRRRGRAREGSKGAVTQCAD